jgi:hypothetical protein
VLVYRYAPVRSRATRARSTCLAASAARPGAGPAPGAPPPPQFRDGVTDETRPSGRPARGCPAAKSFLHHFVVKALLSLI